MPQAVREVAIVTGAGRGIGRAIALRLAGGGAVVIAADRDEAGAAETAREIAQSGGDAVTVHSDLATTSGRQRCIEAALERHRRLDILVNNAGIVRVHRPEAVTEEEWDQIMDVNLKAVFFACTAARPHMARGGRIVNLASIAGKLPTPWWAPYGVSKAGVISLTRSLAVAFAPDVRVNCVCPGPAETEMWRYMNEEGADRVNLPRGRFAETGVQNIPLGRFAKPDDVAGVVAFLCSPEAAYMTGQAVNVSGGRVFH
jgi:NAD(P)-dependent dehydrogenase (short-subunit alcohol dehydrogenase family)